MAAQRPPLLLPSSDFPSGSGGSGRALFAEHNCIDAELGRSAIARARLERFGLWLFHFRARLEAARIDFHAGPSKRADRRQELPRERAMASGRLRKGGRDEIFSLALGETQAGLGRELTREALLLPEPGPSLGPPPARESRRWPPSGRARSGSRRSRPHAPSRNSFPREAKTVRDKPPAFPTQGTRHFPERAISRLHPAERRGADGEPALGQVSDRVRQTP